MQLTSDEGNSMQLCVLVSVPAHENVYNACAHARAHAQTHTHRHTPGTVSLSNKSLTHSLPSFAVFFLVRLGNKSKDVNSGSATTMPQVCKEGLASQDEGSCELSVQP